jgi:hypothetical protein
LLDSFTAVQLARASPSLRRCGAGGDFMARRKRLTPPSRKKAQAARGSWGGKRKGAGRKRKLTESKRKEIASEYLNLKRQMRDELEGTPRREAIIRRLMKNYARLEPNLDLTQRMVVRSVDEFLSAAKPDADIFGYAVEGLNEIYRLPDEENKIRKLKPGMYEDRRLKLRLVLNAAGKWIFRFLWDEVCCKVLGDSKTPLQEVRKRAIKARGMLISGKNPITGEWLNKDLKRAHSKS